MTSDKKKQNPKGAKAQAFKMPDKIELLPVAEIIPYENNPRHNDGAVESVAESIRQFGFKQPIIVDAQRVIVCGHTRVKAAIQLGMESVPCIVASDLTPDQVKALRLVDNKTGELAEWDDDLLRAELESLEMDMGVFNLDFSGIEPEDGDFESLDVDTDNSTGTNPLLLVFGKYRLNLSPEEHDRLTAALNEYSQEAGTLFGFVEWICNKAGVGNVKERAQ